MDILQTLNHAAQKYAQKSALIFKGESVSFFQLAQNVAKLANGLKALGVGKSVKIGLYLPNSPEYVYSYLACFSLGAVVVPLDYQLKDDELISCLDHAEAKFLIAKERPDVS